MDYKQATNKAITLATKHTMPTPRTSAGIALTDALALQAKGRFEDSYYRAMTSLKHSVGVFHKDYIKGVVLGQQG